MAYNYPDKHLPPNGKSPKTRVVRWKKQSWTIGEDDFTNLRNAYLKWCNDTESGELWMHHELVNAFKAVGIRGLEKDEYKHLGASL